MGWIAPDTIAPGDTSVVDGHLGPVPDGNELVPDYESFTRQAFTVRFEPDHHLRVHFHPVDQFQVFIAGDARFANHDVAAGTVHYADRFTPYGPLTAGPGGVSFHTLRSEAATGASYMPDSREALAQARRAPGTTGRRNVSFHIGAGPADGSWVDHRTDADGLRIAGTTLGPHDAATTTIGGDGAFAVVVDGALADGGGIGTLRWYDPGDDCEAVAGDDGAVVALLQLPERHRGA